MLPYFIPVIFGVLQFVGMALVGWGLRASNRFSTRFFNELSAFMLDVALPFYYFSRLSRANLDQVRSSAFFPAAALVLYLGMLGITWIYFSARGYPAREKRPAMAMGTFGNSGFMALFMAELFPAMIPALQSRFGVTTPLLYIGTFVLVTSPLLWAVGTYLVTGTTGRPRPKDLITPPLIGILAGLAVSISGLGAVLLNAELPFYHLMTSIDKVGGVAFSMLIVCLGASIANIKVAHRDQLRAYLRLGLDVSAIRFLVMPGLFFAAWFLVIRPFGLSPTHGWVLFLEMVVPTANSFPIIASRVKDSGDLEDRVGFALLVNYLLYIVALPLWLMLFLSLPGVLQ
jgi:predicted permease